MFAILISPLNKGWYLTNWETLAIVIPGEHAAARESWDPTRFGLHGNDEE
jgi:hypothetical protein